MYCHFGLSPKLLKSLTSLAVHFHVQKDLVKIVLSVKLPQHHRPWKPQCQPLRRTWPCSVQPLLRTQLPEDSRKQAALLGLKSETLNNTHSGDPVPRVSSCPGSPSSDPGAGRTCTGSAESSSFSLEDRVTCVWERAKGTPPPQSTNLRAL